MSDTPRTKFKKVQDWHQYIEDLRTKTLAGQQVNFNPLELRLNCYKEIEAVRGRPLLVYATKFVTNQAVNAPISIEISDVDGFTDLINSVPENKRSVDILIHSPGGQADATERIVYLLRKRFDEIHFLIPHSAYSAATMLALAGDTITLHSSATLGPIDPQINGLPARLIKKGFIKVRDSIKPETLPAYLPLIEKYTLQLLELCDDSEALSQLLVTEWLGAYMLKTEAFNGQIKKAVDFFSNYESHLIHSRPLVLEKLGELQLKISYAEAALNELLWEAYIVIDGFFQLSQFVKLFENTYGISWGRQFGIIATPAKPPTKQDPLNPPKDNMNTLYDVKLL